MCHLDDFLRRFVERDWAGLNELTAVLFETDGNGAVEQACRWEDDLQRFHLFLSGSRGMESVQRFWGITLKSCETISQLRSYLRRSAQREGLREQGRHPAETLLLRRQTAEVLAKNCPRRFHGYKGKTKAGDRVLPIYGLATWTEGPDQRGIFDSFQDWHSPALRDRLKGFLPFPRQFASTRRRPYRDEDIEEGCVRLLDACSRYAEPAHLARGLIAHEWCRCYRIDLPLDDPRILENQSDDSDPTNSVLRHEAHQAVCGELRDLLGDLSHRQRVILLERFLPNCSGERGKTLQQLAHQFDVTPTTISNEEKRIVARFREVFEFRYREDPTIGVVLFAALNDLVENGQLCRLEEGGDSAHERLP